MAITSESPERTAEILGSIQQATDLFVTTFPTRPWQPYRRWQLRKLRGPGENTAEGTAFAIAHEAVDNKVLARTPEDGSEFGYHHKLAKVVGNTLMHKVLPRPLRNRAHIGGPLGVAQSPPEFIREFVKSYKDGSPKDTYTDELSDPFAVEAAANPPAIEVNLGLSRRSLRGIDDSQEEPFGHLPVTNAGREVVNVTGGAEA